MAKLPTLQEFIGADWGAYPRNSYVKHPDFRVLYVRRSQRYLTGIGTLSPCLDIGVIEAKKPRQGSFKKLVKELKNFNLYIENVHPEYFQKGLEKMGFSKVDLDPPCYYLLKKSKQSSGISLTRKAKT